MIHLKNEKEIAGIRASCQLLSRLYDHLLPQIHEGMSTKDIDTICVAFIKQHGGIPAWYSQNFPGAVCVSMNEEVIHGIPSSKRFLKNGDLVSLDIGINLNGYISDAARSIIIGNASEAAKRLLQTTKDCLAAGIAACKAGNRISDISCAVYSVAKKAGYGVVSDFCGHAVGLAVHEDPQIPNVPGHGPNPRIKPGMVLAIEPMINLGTGNVYILEDDWTVVTADGKLSAHQEHTVAVFSDRTEILTA